MSCRLIALVKKKKAVQMGLVCAVDYARLSITPRQYGDGGSLEDQPQSSRTKMLPSLQLLGPVHTKTIV